MYHVVTYPEALPYYAEVFGVLELAPWNGLPYSDEKPDGPMRDLIFGSRGQGKVTYLILEWDREVHVLIVQWIG